MNNQYETLAKRALDILEITYSETAKLDELTSFIEGAFSLAASSTEIELNKIVKILADELRNRGERKGIEKLLEELDDKHQFSKYWD